MQLLKCEKYSTALPFIVKVKWIWDPLTSALCRVVMSETEQSNMFEIDQSNCKRPDKDKYKIERQKTSFVIHNRIKSKGLTNSNMSSCGGLYLCEVSERDRVLELSILSSYLYTQTRIIDIYLNAQRLHQFDHMITTF